MVTLQKIQIVDINQVKQLQVLSKTTFTESFATSNTDENLKSYFKQTFSIKNLSNQIGKPCSRFFFILVDDHVCGYFKINVGECQTEIKENEGLELERIYILAKYQGKKLGETVLRCITKIAQSEQKKYIWLGVWEHNPKAIRFYERFGFLKFDTHIYPIGNDPQTDWMMKLML